MSAAAKEWTADAALQALEAGSTSPGDVESAAGWLHRHIAPLAQKHHSSINQLSIDEVKSLAKQYGAAVTRALKVLGARLTPTSGSTPAALEALSSASCTALDALDVLRPALKSGGSELEVQRYGFVRKLTALGAHDTALRQGLALHARLQASCSQGAAQQLECQPKTWPSGQVGDLLAAAIANLLVCSTELSASSPERCSELLSLVQQPVLDLFDRIG